MRGGKMCIQIILLLLQTTKSSFNEVAQGELLNSSRPYWGHSRDTKKKSYIYLKKQDRARGPELAQVGLQSGPLDGLENVKKGIGLLCCFRTTFCNWWSHEFCSLPENPEGECPTTSSCPESQVHLGDQVKVWTQIRLRCFGMTGHSCLKTLHRGWIQIITSTVMWKTHRHLPQMLDVAKGGTTSYRVIVFRGQFYCFTLNK